MAYYLECVQIDCDEENKVAIEIEHIAMVKPCEYDESCTMVSVAGHGTLRIKERFSEFMARLARVAGAGGG